MARFEDEGPFSGAPLEDVKLQRAPLVRVLAQIRFSGAVAALFEDNAISKVAGPFSDAGYPLLQLDQMPEGLPPGIKVPRWVFQNEDKSWQVSLTPEFLALDTGAYSDRTDFLQRLRGAVDALNTALGRYVRSASRVGFRYINRIEATDLVDLRGLVRSEFHGGLAVPEGNARFVSGLSEAVFSFGPPLDGPSVADGLQARWGVVPPGSLLDVSTPPVAESSWILDIDSFRHGTLPTNGEALVDVTRDVSDRAYRFFRWATNAAFLERFGGTRTATAGTEDLVPTHVPHRFDDPRSESDEVRWLHEQSGLTWEQLGRLFGVSRRTVHLWANGSGMNASNREALYELVALVRSVQGETPAERRRWLLSPGSSGRSPLDSFRDRRLIDEPINRPAAYAAEALDATLDPAVRES